MIRRDLVTGERDQRVVKWSLTAAAFALSLGFFAETALERHVDETTPVSSQSVEATAPVTAAVRG